MGCLDGVASSVAHHTDRTVGLGSSFSQNTKLIHFPPSLFLRSRVQCTLCVVCHSVRLSVCLMPAYLPACLLAQPSPSCNSTTNNLCDTCLSFPSQPNPFRMSVAGKTLSSQSTSKRRLTNLWSWGICVACPPSGDEIVLTSICWRPVVPSSFTLSSSM